MVTGGSVWDFFGIGGTVTSGGEGQQHWHRLEKIGNDQYISFLDNIDIQHVSLHQTHCSYTSFSRRSNMTFDSLLNHPIGSGIVFPTKKKKPPENLTRKATNSPGGPSPTRSMRQLLGLRSGKCLGFATLYCHSRRFQWSRSAIESWLHCFLC